MITEPMMASGPTLVWHTTPVILQSSTMADEKTAVHPDLDLGIEWQA
jgi:hypothetical protein